MYNLIEERWIPVRCRSGAVRMIAPWEITEDSDAPMEVCHPRPDFNSGITQFLIAAVQTAMMPEDDGKWFELLTGRPDPDALRARMSAFGDAFELTGSEHPFMQDKEAGGAKEPKESLGLLISTPGENTKALNKDLFVKRDDGRGCLCMSCAASALFTLQSMAPVGGAGLRASIRGSSAATTIVLGRDLWTTVCLNVLTVKGLSIGEGADPGASPFGWMSEWTKDEITPKGRHPATVYWAIPRRILFEEPSDGTCSICGREGACIHGYREIKNGLQYREWEHPLSPYVTKNGKRMPMAMKSGFTRLDNWAAAAYSIGGSTTGRSGVVLRASSQRGILTRVLGRSYSLWVSGYDNKQALPLSWVDITVPVLIGGEQELTDSVASDMVVVADTASGTLAVCSVKALERNSGGAPKVNKRQVETRFWTECSTPFKDLISRIDGDNSEELLGEWIRTVQRMCFGIFAEITDTVPLEGYGKVAEAEKLLRIGTSEKKLMGKLRNDK